VIEHREDGKRHGLIAEWTDEEEAIAAVVARLIL
jgi:hypothetical protein